MAHNAPFSPGATATLAVTATNTQANISAVATKILVTNEGPNTAFVRWGGGAQTAAVTDTPVLSGDSVLFAKAPDADSFAAICAATKTAALYVTSGN